MFGLWKGFSRDQFKNMIIYILGIMFYKFALEWYNGAFITLATDRFGDSKYKKLGILTGLNYAMQCVGSIIVAPLIKRYPTRSVLSIAVFIFGLISAILLIVDGATGGVLRFKTADGNTHYGDWNPNGLFPIYIVSGVSYGTVELIRRVIPRDIVGGDVQLLRRMDATVHILYEVAGTIGAFTSVALIDKFGYNYSFLLSPIFFTFAAIIWYFVDVMRPPQRINSLEEFERESINSNYFGSVWSGFTAFFKASYYGAFLVFSHRSFVWLVSGYALALYGHRYLENSLAPFFAKSVLGQSSWAQIIIGGSNIGELFGAMSVLLTTNYISTPLPWLRLDGLALNIVWILPFIAVQPQNVKEAWRIAAIFLPISYGWAAGDVSLAAYIQATLAKIESTDSNVSSLGAVMAFLYVLYIVIYAILDTVLGNWADKQILPAAGAVNSPESRTALKFIGGVQFTVLSIIIISSTFVPKGSFTLNPDFEYFNRSYDSKDDDSTSEEIDLNAKEVVHATI